MSEETDYEEWEVPEDLSDEDAINAITEIDFEFGYDDSDHANELVPVVAVVGRPNVGKSTLVNRIIGRREAVVEDVPGVTRDRVFYDAEWNGKYFKLIDTGGYESDAKGLGAQIAAQAEIAVQMADIVLLIVDAAVGSTNDDEAVIKICRRAKKPVILVANKVDDQRTENESTALWNLGLGQPFAVSALHGRGSGDLLDEIVNKFADIDPANKTHSRLHRIALIGKPNVGKSSLLNRLAGENRVVVDEVAGTTVDPVDEVVKIDGEDWLIVDTAGIRKRFDEASGHEYYAVLRTKAAIERAEVILMLIDSSEIITEQDQRILSMVVDSGRALVLLLNKWDLLDEERQFYLEREISNDLQQIDWAPRANVAATTGRNVQKIAGHVRTALENWNRRIPTRKLNQFMGELVAAHPHPVRSGKQPKILFVTQAGVRPPTFVLFTSGFIDPGYRRFIERRLREEFDFRGTPIRIQMRIRSKKKS
ncbi:MAG: ribosome biogenesis GTPase Der [Actinobacteria bacterium]|nr:ribosome biogenesis GTPase Der [Actinomycetota bacterium]